MISGAFKDMCEFLLHRRDQCLKAVVDGARDVMRDWIDLLKVDLLEVIGLGESTHMRP